ncbi:conserved exported hypothetical protein [Crenothrix polyspora]|uniref:Glycine zipper 2TM domain-containing protein n=1 Tax=Crenothrix polyspora TaxID=360316 RepID=A0A1R4HIX4_9GAMM|nr:hypothetical protein [Crenothrix polyspora]SJM96149.1 conserved exported hypothetical protein [Crenothrix polyspora]
MNKKLFLISLTALTLFCSSVVEAKNQRDRHHGRQDYRYQQQHAYYPQYPQYQASQSHPGLTGGVLGSVLGYEIAKSNPVVSELGAVSGSYLGNHASEKH